MLPGSTRVCPAAPWSSLASCTVGIACWLVHCASCRLAPARLMMPKAAVTPAATTKTVPTSRSRRRLGVLMGSGDIGRSDRSGAGRETGCRGRRRGLLVVAGMHDAEQCRHEEQGGASGQQQTADHGTAERRVLPGLD